MAKISIIVPYLKGPAYLEDCIQSIEDQKMDDIEVVLAVSYTHLTLPTTERV